MNKTIKVLIRFFCLSLISIFLNSCIVKHEAFYYDNGWKHKVRYSMIEDKDFELLVDVEDSLIDISFFTSANVSFIKQRGINIRVKDIIMVLMNTNDTLKAINQKELTYSCPSFNKKIHQNKKMHLKFEYIIDSMGIEKNQFKEYDLIKKRDCHLSIRVH